MAGPYLPILSISRSQNVRIGKGPGNAVPSQLQQGIGHTLPTAFYVDLSDGESRKDLAHHLSLGAVVVVGAVTSNNSGMTTFPTTLDALSGGGVGSATDAAVSKIENLLWPQFLVQGWAPAATLTPDPRLGEQYVVTPALTAPIQFLNPPVASQVIGRRLRITVMQDATGGRAVTFDTLYRPGATAFPTTASQTFTISFVWDGLNWTSIAAPYRLT